MHLKEIILGVGIGMGIAGLALQSEGCAPVKQVSSSEKSVLEENNGIPYANPQMKNEDWLMQNTPAHRMREALNRLYFLRSQYLEEVDSIRDANLFGFNGSVVFQMSSIHIDETITHCAQYFPEDTISYVLQLHHGKNQRIVALAYHGNVTLPVTLQIPVAKEMLRISDTGIIGLHWDGSSPDYAIVQGTLYSMHTQPSGKMAEDIQEIELKILERSADLLLVGVSELKLKKSRLELQRKLEKEQERARDSKGYTPRKT